MDPSSEEARAALLANVSEIEMKGSKIQVQMERQEMKTSEMQTEMRASQQLLLSKLSAAQVCVSYIATDNIICVRHSILRLRGYLTGRTSASMLKSRRSSGDRWLSAATNFLSSVSFGV